MSKVKGSVGIYIIFLVLIAIVAVFFVSGYDFKNTPPDSSQSAVYTVQLDNSPDPSGKQSLQLKTLKFIKVIPQVTADCGYKSVIGTSENTILQATIPGPGESVGSGGLIKAFYADEWPITLGSGNVSPLTSVPDHVLNPNVGDKNAKDGNGFPYFPALFVSDITDDPNNKFGDAQSGGQAFAPSEIYGTWKTLGINARASCRELPSQNFCNKLNLGGPDTFPASSNLLQQGSFVEPFTSAEIIWKVDDLGLTTGRTYRVEIILHDGDSAGDIGIACTTIKY